MKNKLSAALLAGGLLLLYFGYVEYQSFGSEVELFFGGTGSNQAIVMIIFGTAASIGGLVGLLRSNN